MLTCLVLLFFQNLQEMEEKCAFIYLNSEVEHTQLLWRLIYENKLVKLFSWAFIPVYYYF